MDAGRAGVELVAGGVDVGTGVGGGMITGVCVGTGVGGGMITGVCVGTDGVMIGVASAPEEGRITIGGWLVTLLLVVLVLAAG